MSLPLETLQRLEELVANGNEANHIGTDTPALLINGKIVDIEHLQEGRSRYRGRFSTSVMAEFAAYLRNKPGAELFVSPEVARATAYLNLGTQDSPGHGDWAAVLTLKNTAAYQAAVNADGRNVTQRELAEWAEDWAACLTAVRDDESVNLGTAIAAIRNINIVAKKDVGHQDSNFGAKRSALEEIEAKGAGGLPTHFVITTPPHIGFAERAIKLRLSVITGDAPRLCLRIVAKEALQESIQIEFKERLLAAASEHVSHAVVGDFSI